MRSMNMDIPLVCVFIMLGGLLTGCAVPSVNYYDIELIEVERPKDVEERYGESEIVTLEDENGGTKYSFEDESIKIFWTPTYKQFWFLITNKTNHSMKIVWDDSTFVYVDNVNHKIAHSGMTYADRYASHLPSVIAKGTTITDFVFPADNIYYRNGWKEHPIFPILGEELEENIRNKFAGKIVQVMLPLQIREVVNEYIFTFKIYPHEKLMGTHERYKVYKAKMFVGIATVLIAAMLIPNKWIPNK